MKHQKTGTDATELYLYIALVVLAVVAVIKYIIAATASMF